MASSGNARNFMNANRLSGKGQTMKCLACGWIIRKDHGQAVAHPCNPPQTRRKRPRTYRENSIETWARRYNESEGHEAYGGPEDR